VLLNGGGADLNPHATGDITHIHSFFIARKACQVIRFIFDLNFYEEKVIYKLLVNQIWRIRRSGLWAAITVVCVEPFFVPFEVLAAFFGFAAHTLVFACSFVYQFD